MNWLNLGMYIFQAVIKIEQSLKANGATKKQKAIEISDLIMNAVEVGMNKEILSYQTVTDTRSKLIDAIVAFENAVAEAKFNLNPKPEGDS